MTAVTWPSTSIPRVVVSYPQTLTQVEMKCREYEYVYLGNQFRILKVLRKATNLETHEIRTKHAIEDFLSAYGYEGLGESMVSGMKKPSGNA